MSVCNCDGCYHCSLWSDFCHFLICFSKVFLNEASVQHLMFYGCWTFSCSIVVLSRLFPSYCLEILIVERLGFFLCKFVFAFLMQRTRGFLGGSQSDFRGVSYSTHRITGVLHALFLCTELLVGRGGFCFSLEKECCRKECWQIFCGLQDNVILLFFLSFSEDIV